jgi:hypothetical protein
MLANDSHAFHALNNDGYRLKHILQAVLSPNTTRIKSRSISATYTLHAQQSTSSSQSWTANHVTPYDLINHIKGKVMQQPIKHY